MNTVEMLMYQLSGLFLAPVLLLILVLFGYAFVSLGTFAMEAWQRHRGRAPCPLEPHVGDGATDSEALELVIMRRLEPLRITARTSPMLGLVATMIPLGPALLALGDGDVGTVGEHLTVAFAAVILALITASITFWILTVRRRWLLAALKRIEDRA